MTAFPKPLPKMREKRQPLKAKRETHRRSGRDRDPAYLARVRALPCCLKCSECKGRTEGDHAGPRPLGRKCHDHEAIPLCQLHHWMRTNYLGYFARFTAVQMRAWCDAMIAATRARLGWKPAPTKEGM